MQLSPNHPDDLDLMAFADNELPDPLAARMRDHLAACLVCQTRLDAWADLFVRVEQGDAVRHPRDLREPVMRSLRATREAPRRFRWLLVGELLASIGLLVVLLGALRQLGHILVQWIEPIPRLLAVEESWLTFVGWLDLSLEDIVQAAALAWQGVKAPSLGFTIPASWWPWLAALAVVSLLGNGLLLDSGSLNPFRKGDQRG